MGTSTQLSALTWLLAASSLFAANGAYSLSQPNLTVIGNDARTVGIVAARISRHREFLESSVPALRARQLPLTVVEVSDTDFQSFGVPADVPAFFVQLGQEGLIAVREPMLSHPAAVAHEVFHAVVRQSGWSVPEGLEEGLAEYFATANYDAGGRVSLGAAAAARVRRLQSEDLRALANTLHWRGATGERLVLGSEEAHRAYDANFAAAHWLLQASGASLSDAGAWLTPAPEVLRRMDRELPRWLRSGILQTREYAAPAEPRPGVAQEAAYGLRESALMRVLMQCNQSGAAERLATELKIGGAADSGLVHAALGRLASRLGRFDEAASELRLATVQLVADASTWRQLAFAEGRLGHQAAVAAALKHVLDLNPGDDESRMVRASILLWLGQLDEGLAELALVSQAPQGREVEFARLQAQGKSLRVQHPEIVAANAAAANSTR
jgi:hypothetical protein